LDATTTSVGILLFDDVEVLDFCGPFEVFSMAARLAGDASASAPAPFRVFTVAQERRVVAARGGLFVEPHFSFADHLPIDLLIVPGGQGTRQEVGNAVLVQWIAHVAAQATICASVCTGAFLLAQAGLLHGRRVTTHWASLDRLAAAYADLSVERDRRWVDEGAVVTSAGVSAGIDMSLHLVERLLGRDTALATARQMEYRWQSEPA